MTPDQSSKLSSIYSILSLYLAQNNADSQMLKSIFVRYLVPSLGGVKPQGSRARADEIAQSLSFLENVESAKILKLESMLDEQMNQQNVDKKLRRKLVYYVRKFIAWCQSNNYLSTSTQKKEEDDFIKLHASAGEARRDWHAKGQGSKKYHRTTKKHQPYRLGCSHFPDDYFNPRLARQLSELDKYRVSKGCSAATIKKDRMHLEHILGWLHRYKNYSLDELSLNIFAPFISLKVQNLDFNSSEDYILEKARIEQKAEKLANQALELIEEYLDFLNGSPSSSLSYLEAIVSVCKFMYKDEIDDDDVQELSSVPLIKKLRKLRKNFQGLAERSLPTVPYEERSVPWEEAVKVVENLRLRYEQKYLFYTSAEGKTVKSRKRTDLALQRDLQDFLSVAFIIARSPLRSRNYFELELGKTLKFGKFVGMNFIPAGKLENPTDAEWFIYLKPDQYKTGKKGGIWWGNLPNLVFKNGQTLYEYIEEWLSWGRELTQKCDHNYFFRGTYNYKPLNVTAWRSRIHDIFVRETGVSVTPHSFRSMYVTYLVRNGVSEQMLEGAAVAQLHSRNTQRKYYDKLDKQSKMEPVIAWHEKEIQSILEV